MANSRHSPYNQLQTAEVLRYDQGRTKPKYKDIDCSFCGGKGYRSLCPQCSNNIEKGTVNCADCFCTGRRDKCPECYGTKLAPCPACLIAEGRTPSLKPSPQ